MRRSVKLAIASISAIFVLVVFFVFGLPVILRSVTESRILKYLNRQAKIESISFNPFTLCLTIKGLSIQDRAPDKPFVSFDLLRINAEIVSVFKSGIVLREITFERPCVHIVRTDANTYSFSDMIPAGKQKTEPDKSKPLLFSAANIRIINGEIEFRDLPKNTTHSVTGLELSLPLISNFEHQIDVFAQPMFSATINGKPFKMTGQTKPFADSLETRVEMNIKELALSQYLPYVPMPVNFKMPSGRLDVALSLSYVQKAKRRPEIRVQGKLGLDSLELVSLTGEPIFRLLSLKASEMDLRLNDRDVTIGDIVIKGLGLSFARNQDGRISLQSLVETDNRTAGKTGPSAQDSDAGQKWKIRIKKLGCADGTVVFNDQYPSRPAKFSLDSILVTAENISNEKEASAALDLKCLIGNESPLNLTGTFSLNPLEAALKADLSNLDIVAARSYLPGTIDLDLTDGVLDLKGSFDFRQAKDAVPDILWQGDIYFRNFAASRRGDRRDVIKFSSLDFQSMRSGTNPFSLDIKTVRLSEFFIHPVVEPDGILNFTRLNRGAETTQAFSAPDPSAKGSSLEVNIGLFDFKKGWIQFVDKNINPRYSADLADIQGRISNISTKPDTLADIKIGAKLNRYAPAQISGRLGLLHEKLDADIKVLVENIDINPFSPYSGKYIGRVIEKGSLNLDLDYDIRKNRLSSQNRVFLDQFTLGKKVKSKSATSLPVGLAVSLLKDRKGEIHLDLPVSGNLDDPEFKLRKVILQVLVNLVEKAVTSPFALMGKMIPDGVDVSNIVFKSGTFNLDDEAIKKMDVLAGLLNEKKDLNLEIQAVAVADLDREGLREERVMDKLRRKKFFSLPRKARKGLTTDQVVILPEEYQDYLWKAYKAERFQKPKGLLGLNKRLPADEMKALMLKHTAVDDSDLKDLLHRRGISVKQYLVEKHQISADRMFIVEPRLMSGENLSGSCVEFSLK